MPLPAPDPLFVLRGHRGEVQALCFSSGAASLWSGDSDGEVRCWSLEEQRPVVVRRLHEANAGVLQLGVANLPEPALVTQGRDGVLRSWALQPSGDLSRDPCSVLESGSYNFCRFSLMQRPAEQGEEQQQQQQQQQQSGGAAQQQQQPPLWHGPLVAAPCDDPSTVVVWRLGEGPRPLLRFEQPRPKEAPQHGMAMALHLFSDTPGTGSPMLLAGYEDGSVALWDARAPGRPLAAPRLHTEPVMALTLGPHSSSSAPAAAADAAVPATPPPTAGRAGPLRGISGSADASLVFLAVDPAAGTVAAALSRTLPSPGVGDAAVRSDGRVAATAHWDGRVRLWHARKGAPLGVLRYHSKAATAVAFGGHPSTGMLASGGRDGAVALWRVFSQREDGGRDEVAAAAATGGE